MLQVVLLVRVAFSSVFLCDHILATVHPSRMGSEGLHVWMWFPNNAMSVTPFPWQCTKKGVLWLWLNLVSLLVTCLCSHKPIAHVCVLYVCLYTCEVCLAEWGLISWRVT